MNKQITVFSGVLLNQGKVLLSQRDEIECPQAHLKWEFPGGICDFGEKPTDAVKREFMVETSREIEVGNCCPILELTIGNMIGACCRLFASYFYVI